GGAAHLRAPDVPACPHLPAGGPGDGGGGVRGILAPAGPADHQLRRARAGCVGHPFDPARHLCARPHRGRSIADRGDPLSAGYAYGADSLVAGGQQPFAPLPSSAPRHGRRAATTEGPPSARQRPWCAFARLSRPYASRRTLATSDMIATVMPK